MKDGPRQPGDNNNNNNNGKRERGGRRNRPPMREEFPDDEEFDVIPAAELEQTKNAMNLSELKTRPVAALVTLGESMGIENLARSRKQDIIFSVLKAHAFCWLLLIDPLPALVPGLWAEWAWLLEGVGAFLVYLSVAICLVRGLPVVAEFAYSERHSILGKLMLQDSTRN